MSRQCLVLAGASLLLLCGCPAEDVKTVNNAPPPPPIVQPNDQPTTTTDPSSTDQTPSENNSPTENRPPVDKTPIDVPPIDFSDIPPAPAGFTGEDQPADTPIPEDVQRKLKTYEDGYVAGLIEILTYPNAGVREQAIDRLGYLDEEEHDIPAVIQALRGALKDPVLSVRSKAAYRLAGYKVNAKNALPELAAMLSETDKDLLDNVLYAIGMIGEDAAPLVPQLIELLKKEKQPNRDDVINTLGDIGPASRPAIPLLVEQLERYDDDAAIALGMIGAERELQQAMVSDSQFVRKHGATGAEYLAEHSPQTVDRLLKMVTGDSYEYTRSAAAEALSAVRPTTKEITLALGKATQDENETVRREAAIALGKSEPPFDEAIPFLIELTKDKEEWVREVATSALGKFKGSPDTRLAVILDQMVAGVEAYSGQEAALQKGAVEFYPLLRAMALDNEMEEVRRSAAILGLQELYGNRDFLTDEIDKELGSLANGLLGADQPDTVRGAAAMLYHFHRNKNEYYPRHTAAFVAGLNQTKYDQVRMDAALILSYKRKTEAIPGLIEMLKSPNEKLRDSAVNGIGDFRKDASAAIPVLIELASDTELPRRYGSIIAIGKIATQPELTQPALMQLLDDDEESVRNNAAKSLANVIAENELDATAALKKILPLYDDKKIDNFSFVHVAERLGPQAAVATDRLVALFENKYLKDDAANALGAIGPAAKDAAPALIDAAVNWEDHRTAALRALANIKAGGAEFAAVAPKLLDDLATRNYTLQALGAMGPDAAAALPEIAKLLDSEEEQERSTAAKALGGMGEAAQDYVPQLKKMAAEDSEEYVRREARGALLAILPDDPEILEASLAGADQMRSRSVQQLIESLGERAPTVVQNGLKSDKPEIRKAAMRLLPEVVEDDQAMPMLIAALDDEEIDVRRQAALYLHEQGHSSPKMLPIFIEALGGDSDWELRSAIESHGRAAITPLIDTIVDPTTTAKTAETAIHTLRGLSNSARIPKAKLRAALAGGDANAELHAATALVHADRHDHSGLPVLLTALDSDDEARQKLALGALQQMEWEDDILPPEISAALVKLLTNEESARDAASTINYRKLDPSQLPAMLELLASEETRDVAVNALYNGALVDEQLIAPLVAILREDEQRNRSYVRNALVSQGKAASEPLMQVLLDEDASEGARSNAGNVLLSLDIEKTNANLQRIRPLLQSDQPPIRRRAAALLAAWDEPWEPLEASLVQIVKGDDHDVRYAAIRAMQDRPDDLRSAKAQWIKMLQSGDENQAATAANFLTIAKETSPEVTEALVNGLLNVEDYQRGYFTDALLNDETMRPAGLAALRKRAETASDAEKAILLEAFINARDWPQEERAPEIALARASLSSDNAALKRQAAITLAHLDDQPADCAPILAQHLIGERDRIDHNVIYALRQLGPQAKPAVPELIKLLEKEDATYYALQALAAIGPDANEAVPNAIELLSHERMFVHAAEFLGNVGPTAKDATPALLAQLDQPKRMRAATRALANIGAPNDQILPALYKHLKNPHLRYDAVAALGELGEQGAEAVPVLNRAMTLGDPELTVVSVNSLAQLKSVAADSADELAKAIDDPDTEVRGAAARALGQIAAQPAVSVPALTKALTDADSEVRGYAARSLAAFKADAAPAVVALSEALQDERTDTQAAFALGEIGEAAAAAVPALVKLHETDEPYPKSVYAAALWKIDPAAAKKAGAEEPTP